MSFQDTLTPTPAITAPEEDRVGFIMRTYQHVMIAVAAFVALEFLAFQTGVAERIYEFAFTGGGGRWLLLLGGFMVGQWFVGNAAVDIENPARQYGALFGTSALYALLFAPFLWMVYKVMDAGSTVAAAAGVTGIGFVFLSAVAFFTRKDLSFLRPIVMWGFGAALLLIVGGVFFGFNLGVWFSVAMIALSGAAILYQTQDMIRRYPTTAHVAAAVALFGSLMTMFWYVLRLFMQLSRE